MTGILQQDQYTFVIVSRQVILRMKIIPVINFSENQNTHFMSNKFSFPKIVPSVR